MSINQYLFLLSYVKLDTPNIFQTHDNTVAVAAIYQKEQKDLKFICPIPLLLQLHNSFFCLLRRSVHQFPKIAQRLIREKTNVHILVYLQLLQTRHNLLLYQL